MNKGLKADLDRIIGAICRNRKEVPPLPELSPWEQRICKAEELGVPAHYRGALLCPAHATPAAGVPAKIRQHWIETMACRAACGFFTFTWPGHGRRPHFLLLLGGVGTGKTYALRAYQIETEAVYWRASAIMRWYDSPIKGMLEAQGHASLMAPYLIIDDLGAEMATRTEASESALEQIVDGAYENHRTLLIGSNLNPGDFAERYGERVISRIRQYGQVWELGEEDLRKKFHAAG